MIDYFAQKTSPLKLTYLGYELTIVVDCQNGKLKNTDVSFQLSSDKYKRITRRIDNAFKHFDFSNKYDLHQARKDLVDSLKLITGNVRLHKSKSGIKTGLYFNSDLLDEDLIQLQNLTT